jgi:hypothetical protein
MITHRRLVIAVFVLTAFSVNTASKWPAVALFNGSQAATGDGGAPPDEPNKEIFAPTSINAPPSDAEAHCRRMAEAASNIAGRFSIWGWISGIAAAGAIATGPIIIAAEGTTPSTKEKVFSLAIPGAGALLGYLANGFFSYSADYSSLAAQASLALNNGAPVDEVKACNIAFATWNTARSESSASIGSMVGTTKTSGAAGADGGASPGADGAPPAAAGPPVPVVPAAAAPAPAPAAK